MGKYVHKESDDKQNLHYENKTELSHQEDKKEVQLPLIHRLVGENMEDLSREKEMESMNRDLEDLQRENVLESKDLEDLQREKELENRDLEDLQREKELESIVCQNETQIRLPQPMEDKVEVS